MAQSNRITHKQEKGYYIVEIHTQNEDGSFSNSFELYDPSGKHLGNYESIQDAEKALAKIIQTGHKLRM